ncbi:MAG: hypothetical protein ACHBN1_11940 [Heteroscytonema crispum UTEX LB 1556]
MQDQSFNNNPNNVEDELNDLVKAVVEAVLIAKQTQELEITQMIRDQLHRLPDNLMTDVINEVIMNLIQIDPALCRWFIIDIFLKDADPEGKADVAERINLLLADLRDR